MHLDRTYFYIAILSTLITGWIGGYPEAAHSFSNSYSLARQPELATQSNGTLAFRPPVARRWGLRRGPVCPITPGFYDTPLVREIPTFIWAEKRPIGNVKRIAVVSDDSATEIWSATVASTPVVLSSAWSFQQVTYSGDALQPEQEYRWIMLDGLNREIASLPFQLMSPAQRNPIKTELQNLQDRLTDEGETPDAIAWQQANYLADNQLWSDAIGVAFSIPDPSPAQATWRHQITTQLCES